MDDLKKAGIKVIPVVPNLKIAQRMEKLGGRCCNCGRNGGRGSY